MQSLVSTSNGLPNYPHLFGRGGQAHDLQFKGKCQAVRSGAVGVKPRSPRTSYEISSDLCFTQAYRVPAPEHPAHPLLCGSLGEGENNRDGFRAYVIRMALPLSLPLSFFLLGLGVAVLALACLLACIARSLSLSLSRSNCLSSLLCTLYSLSAALHQKNKTSSMGSHAPK